MDTAKRMDRQGAGKKAVEVETGIKTHAQRKGPEAELATVEAEAGTGVDINEHNQKSSSPHSSSMSISHTLNYTRGPFDTRCPQLI